MKIRLDFDGKVFEFEKKPMSGGRFKALCVIFLVLLYVGAVVMLAKHCGPEIFFVILFMSAVFGGSLWCCWELPT